MIKYFKSNNEYFKFCNLIKDKYRVIIVKPLKNRIRVEYEKFT